MRVGGARRRRRRARRPHRRTRDVSISWETRRAGPSARPARPAVAARAAASAVAGGAGGTTIRSGPGRRPKVERHATAKCATIAQSKASRAEAIARHDPRTAGSWRRIALRGARARAILGPTHRQARVGHHDVPRARRAAPARREQGTQLHELVRRRDVRRAPHRCACACRVGDAGAAPSAAFSSRSPTPRCVAPLEEARRPRRRVGRVGSCGARPASALGSPPSSWTPRARPASPPVAALDARRLPRPRSSAGGPRVARRRASAGAAGGGGT